MSVTDDDDTTAPLDPTYARVDPVIGSEVSGYRVTSRLGSGGMGIVYEGEQPIIGKRVAIKVLRQEVADDPNVVQRLVAEARAVNQVGHRGIIDVFGFGRLPDGRQCIVMEYLDGEPLENILQNYVRQGQKLLLADVLVILDEVLSALAAAHSAGVIHRDLKPSNIFLCLQRDGTKYVKLLDFGIAKLGVLSANTPASRASLMIGTPTYMAPEQAAGGVVGPALDLYAIGIIAFELITGAPPFTSDSVVGLLMKHQSEPPPHLPPDVPAALDALVQRLLAKHPADRPASAEAVREELKAFHSQVARGGQTLTLAVQRPRPNSVSGLPAVPSTPTPAKADSTQRVAPLTLPPLGTPAPAAAAPIQLERHAPSATPSEPVPQLPRSRAPVVVLSVVVAVLAMALVLALRPSAPADVKPETPGEAKPGEATLGDAKSADAKSADAKSGDAKSADAKSADAKSGDAKSGDAKSADAKSGDAKSADAKSADAKSADAKSDDTKSADTKSADAKSADAKSGDAKSADTKPADTKSADTKSGDAKSADTKPADTKSADAKSGDAKSPDAKSADAKSGDAKSGDTKSADTKSADAKSADAKSGDTKSADTKSADTKSPLANAKSPTDPKPSTDPRAKPDASAKSSKFDARVKQIDARLRRLEAAGENVALLRKALETVRTRAKTATTTTEREELEVTLSRLEAELIDP
ncbi:MAG: protein kinase [Myxococcaceae bacterium]